MMRLIVSISVLLLLSACSTYVNRDGGVSFKTTVNLLDHLDNTAKRGSLSTLLGMSDEPLNLVHYFDSPLSETLSFPAAISGTLPIGTLLSLAGLDGVLPSRAGWLINFSKEELITNLTVASVRYQVTLTRSDNLRGNLTLQPYLAPENSADVTLHPLGESITYNMESPSQTLSSTILLSAEQLRAVNEERAKVAVQIVGGTLTITQVGGLATLSATVDELTLTEAAGTLNARLPEHDADGMLIDLSQEELPSNVRDVIVDYTITITQSGNAHGTLSAKLYGAPKDETDIWQASYYAGQVDDVALEPTTTFSGSVALNESLRKSILNDKMVRLGVLVTGDINLSSEGLDQVRYTIDKLDLRAGVDLF